MILLVSESAGDTVITLSESVEAGVQTPARRYQQQGRYLTVEGAPQVINHDVGLLQRQGYRLATATEQNEYTRQQRQASSIVE